MTVMATSTRELTINEIVRRSFMLAGLMNPNEGVGSAQFQQKAAMAKDFLEIIVDYLQTEGLFVNAIDFYTLQLVGGTEEYQFPDTTLDLTRSAMYLDPNQTTGETMMTPINREDYQRLTDKTASGRPYLYYADRSDLQVSVFLWPVPSESGTARFQRKRLLADTTDGNATLDLERHWIKYVIWELAHHLAVAGSIEHQRCGYIRSNAEKFLKKAKAYSNQRPPTYMHIDHRGGQRRRN